MAGILANLFQTGPVFSAFPLKPDFDRINPFSGLSRLVSVKMLVESGKSIVKLGLFGAGLYFVLNWFLPNLAGLNQIDSHALLPVLLDRALRVILALLPILAFVALADFIYVRWDYGNRMKMSRRELREEYKQREGDPRIRARIRELRQEMLKRSKSLKRVKDADVLITNPQHLAVALLYKRGEMAAPQVIAKGAGEPRAHARWHGKRCACGRKPHLARSLYRRSTWTIPSRSRSTRRWRGSDLRAAARRPGRGEADRVRRPSQVAGRHADLVLVVLMICI